MVNKKYALAICLLCVCLVGCSNPKNIYEEATKAMNAEQWDQAIELFSSISDYEDSEQLIAKCQEEKGKHEKADYEFLDTMAEVIMSRYEKSQQGESIETCVSYDLAALNKYKDAEFYDQELKELALQYIEGDELQLEALSEKVGHQQYKNYEGIVRRYTALKEMTDNYGLLKDNIDYQVNYYDEVDDVVSERDAYIEISETNKDLLSTIEYVDQYTNRVTYQNITDHDFELYLYFTFYNTSGSVIETTVEYYLIYGQTTNQLDFYVPEGACTVDYAGEIYLI